MKRATITLPDDVLPFVGLGHTGHGSTAGRAEEILAEEWEADSRR